MKDFSKEELLELIQERGLKIMEVLDVKQTGFTSPYKYIVHSQEQLQKDIELFNLTICGQEYFLLTDVEIKHIEKEGYLNETF